MKIVYTYYEYLSYIEYNKYQKSKQQFLIDICEKSWKKYGWNFKVLNENYAKNHFLYNDYKRKILKYPSANADGYDYHCYMRWLAMANIGGGIMIDYDVVNMGLEDFDFFDFSELNLYQGHVPCVVSGKADHYLDMVKNFMNIDVQECIIKIQDKDHTSDMIMLASNKIKFKTMDYVVDYPNIEKLVHCSQNACVNEGVDKIDIMNKMVHGNINL